ncbi:SdrD B-like domain-containing protein [Paracoccus homiensis]|uniref:SdrD B-like domain-containing protein n=1 Tax=Paracoccus homiensis TaxID=364199 RepID=UPI00398CF281
MFCVDENTKLVIDLAAQDADGDALTYKIVGGADGAAFEIDPDTGVLTFKQSPDYENPGDADGNNSYKVIVSVDDGKGGVTTRELTVCVKDVAETPTCMVIEAEDMNLCGYKVGCASSASGNEYVYLSHSTGYAQTTFKGATGEYDFNLRYWEGQGDGYLKVYVNGTQVQTIRLNGQSGQWHEATLEGLDLKQGDVITIKGYGSACDYAIIDKIKLCPSEPEPQPGALEGRVFLDANRDGIDNGEAGVAGVTVQLLNAAGAVVATTTTDANGAYLFDNLEAGDYSVVFPTEVDGRTLTSQNVGGDDTIDSDADVNTGATGSYTVVAGQTTSDVDAGLVEPQPGALTGRVFIDANKDGIDNNETGVSGVTVQLLNAAGAVVATTTTDADGAYLFDNLEAGEYSVIFPTQVDGRVLTAQDTGADDTIDSDADVTTGATGSYTVVAGQTTEDVDAGVKDPGTASLGDTVFIDVDGDGVQSAADQMVAGVAVMLYDDNGAAIASTTTDANGKYLFEGLDAGDYSVGFGAVDGFEFITANAGADDLDSDAGADGRTGTYSLAIGEANLTVDAGLTSKDPILVDDTAGGCADQDITADVLANDSDTEALTITAVNGMAISEGQTITSASGVNITLTGGQLVFDGETAYAALDIGQQATESFSYTVSDGLGGQGTANVDVTFCGDANSLQSLADSLPGSVNYQITSGTKTSPFGDFGYDVMLSGTGDARLDGVVFTAAYCLSLLDPAATSDSFATAPLLTADLMAGTDSSAFSSSQTSFANGLSASENLDLINWLINANFEGANADAVDGSFSGWEVQRAIWELTDAYDTDYLSAANAGYGNNADVDYLVAQALANGEGFVAGDGDIATLVIDPNPASASNSQPFILAFEYDSMDCLCHV